MIILKLTQKKIERGLKPSFNLKAAERNVDKLTPISNFT